MSNVMDYLSWRGDLTFRQDPPNEVDALVFTSLAYIQFPESIVSPLCQPISLREAGEQLFALEDWQTRGLNTHLKIMQAACLTERFGSALLVGNRERYTVEEETQFAAVTFLLDDGSMVLAFRGTDMSLVGWKEDFNMCFLDFIPSQRLALEYTEEMQAYFHRPMILCGHSKGGNLAVYAAAQSCESTREKILAVYNNDGPGFTKNMMGNSGYLAMVPRIHTIVPQSSVIGMLMEHEEPIMIVKSPQIGGVLQHDVFSWEVHGKELVKAEELTSDAKFIMNTVRNWLAGMDREERNQVVDSLFGMLSYGNVEQAPEIFQPRNLLNYIKLLGTDGKLRKILMDQFGNLMDAAKQTRNLDQPSEETEQQLIE